MSVHEHITEMLPAPVPVRERVIGRDEFFVAELSKETTPLILRGVIGDWPAVRAAKSSADELVSYLSQYDKGAVVPVSAGPASLDGRIFYNDDFTGMNVDRGNAEFGEVLRRVSDHGQERPSPVIYLASTDVDECLPGFRTENDLEFGDFNPVVSLWLGTKTRIAAHNDLPLNVACVVAGRRRFKLFPPDQIANLYVGPFELTPAGRPISLVDFAEPDLDRFPRFKAAMETAQVAELNAGDALFLPSMWWHHVEALGAFNILVNYWWRTVPAYLGTPQDVLTHAMLTLRDLPPAQKRAWRDMFDRYVFDFDPNEFEHIPETARGILSPMTKDNARRIRATLLNRLNR